MKFKKRENFFLRFLLFLDELKDAATSTAAVGQFGWGFDKFHTTLIFGIADSQTNILGLSSLENNFLITILKLVVLLGEVDF